MAVDHPSFSTAERETKKKRVGFARVCDVYPKIIPPSLPSPSSFGGDNSGGESLPPSRNAGE